MPVVMRTLPLDRPEAGGRIGGRQPRNERQQHRRNQRQADADPQQRAVDAEIERAHREARRIARDHRQHRPRDQHAEQRAGAAQQHAFGEQRAPQRAGARAKRRANRQLAFAAHRAREDQVGDVRARDDEDQAGRAEQHQQDRARRRGDLIAQLHRVDAEVILHRIRFLVRRQHAAVNGAQLRARLLEVGARREPAEELRHPMHAAVLHRRRHVMRARDDVRDQLRFGGIRHRRLEHADDRRRAIAQLDLLAEHVLVAVQRLGPEAMRQHRHARRLRAIVGGIDQPAANRLQAHHREERSADDAGADDARFAEADQRELDRREVAELRDRLEAGSSDR